MFMFWSKRTLIKRLLKARVRGEHETEREAQEDTSSVQQRFPSSVGNETTAVQQQQQQQQASGGGGGGAAAAAARCIGSSGGGGGRGGEAGGSNLGTGENKKNGKIASRLHQGWCGGDQSQDDEEEPTRVTRCKELLKTLKENQLEMLVTTVESFGADLGTCVLVPRYKPRESCSADSSCCSRNNCRYGYNNSHHSHNRYHHHHHHLYSHNSGHPRHKHHHTSRCCHRCCCHRCRCPGRENAEQREENRREDGEPSGERERWEQRGGASVEDSSAFGVRNATIDARCDVGGSFREGAAAAAAATATATAMLAAEPYESPPPLLDPHLLSCQVWRWPDLANSSELKRLPVCHSAKDPLYVCFNPYHWSRLCKPESPPPPYCLIADRLRPEDCAPSEGNLSRGRNTTAPLPLPGSLTTNGEGDSEQKEWCTLAYWEQSRRVGPLYPVEPSTVNVFDSLHDGDGLCLSSLAGNHNASLVVQRTRSKIGLGLMLSQEADGVWAYNRSKSPIFVNSPTLDDPESRTLLVYRVQPGFCLNIFDRAKTLPYGCGSTNATTTTTTIPTNTTAYSSSTGFNSGPVDMNSVRISFAKGWGPKYSRQEVTSCPCWLEVLLAPCR